MLSVTCKSLSIYQPIAVKEAQQVLEIRIIQTCDGFLALKDEWNVLCARSDTNHFFQSFDWVWQVWNSVAKIRGRKLFIVIGRLGGRLVLVWPLMIADKTLRLISSDTLEYRDLLVEKHPCAESWLQTSWEFIRRNCHTDLYMFQNLRDPANLHQFASQTTAFTAIGGGWCPVIRLDKYADWNGYFQQLPKSLLCDQRRQWKRANEALPGLDFHIVTNGQEHAAIINWIIQHKLAWLSTKQKYAVYFATAEMQNLFKNAAIAANAQHSYVIAKLSAGETIISAGFGYKFGSNFLFHVFSYDDHWNKLSPSRLFLEKLVHWCFDNGVKTFDFMPGDEQYKTIWANDLVRTDSYIGALTAWGGILLWWHMLLINYELPIAQILQPIYRFIPNSFRNTKFINFMKQRIYGLGFKQRPDRPVLPLKNNK